MGKTTITYLFLYFDKQSYKNTYVKGCNCGEIVNKIKLNLSIEMCRSAYLIKNYTLKRCPSLEKSLSVYDYISKKYTHRGFMYDEKNKILKIPSRVELSFILDKCSSDGEIITDIVNNRDVFVKSKYISNIKCLATPRNNFQKEAVDFMVDKMVSDDHKSHKLICLSTGFGKTVTTIMGAIILKVPTVIISINLSNQWIDRLKTFTNGKLGKDIIYLKTWEDIDALVTSDSPPDATFYVVGLDAMNAGIRDDIDKLHKFYEKCGIGLQVFDEFHLHFLKILNVLVNTSVERVLYLSATPARSERSQDALFKRLFIANIPVYGEKTHLINKYNIAVVRFSTKPREFELRKIESRRGVHAVQYFNYMFSNHKNYSIFVDLIKFFTIRLANHNKNKDKQRVMIYIQSLRGIKIVKELLETSVYTGDYKPSIGDYSGNVDKSKRHLELEKDVILSTLANSVGLDVDNLTMVINFIPMSSDIILQQIRGRLRKESSWYVDVTDYGFEGMILQQTKRLINHKRNSKHMSFYEYNSDNRTISKCFS